MKQFTDFLLRTAHNKSVLEIPREIDITVELPEREWFMFLGEIGNMNLMVIEPQSSEVEYAGIKVKLK